MAIASYHILLLHKVYNKNNLKFDYYGNVALTIYTAITYKALPVNPETTRNATGL